MVRPINIFLSSPSDVQIERDIVKRAIGWLRNLHIVKSQFALNVLAYEDSVPPLIGDTPQSAVNKHLGDPTECNILICILWARMGTEFIDSSSGTSYLSGTYYEFIRAYEANQRSGTPEILLYRKTVAIPEDADPAQVELVAKFFEDFRTGERKGLYESFNEQKYLEEKVKLDLLNVLTKSFGLTFEEGTNFDDLRSIISKRFTEANLELRSYPSKFGGIYTVERAEASEVVDWIYDTEVKERVGLLVDRPGSGKTVVMSQILEKLQGRDHQVFSIKADYISGIKSEEELRQRFRLPLSIEDCISSIAIHEPVVVLIDQLDALSLSLSQDYSTLDIIHRLALIVAGIPNVRVIISCREFDLNFDPRLSTLKHSESKKFKLQPLTNEQIDNVLNAIGVFNLSRISPRMRQLLSLPLHLSIIADIVSTEEKPEIPEQFLSLQQLYDKLWQLRIDTSSVPNLYETIFFLAQTMQRERRLSVPFGTLDSDHYKQASVYLQQISFVRVEKGSYVFHHQTLFDYCIARKFVADDRSISTAIWESTQGLFERSLMIQVLAYLRYSYHERFLSEMEQLLFSGQLRFHLRVLLLEWFASLSEPDMDERALALRICQKDDDCRRFLIAAGGNAGWYDRLGEEYFASLLGNKDRRPTVIQFLSTIISRRVQQIVALLEPFLGRSEEWDKAIVYCLLQNTDWTNSHAVEVLCQVIVFDLEKYYLGEFLTNVAKSNPVQACRVARTFLDSRFDNYIEPEQSYIGDDDTVTGETLADHWRWEREIRKYFIDFLDDYHVSRVLAALANAEPISFVSQLMPWFLNVVLRYLHSSERRVSYFSDIVFSHEIFSYHQTPIAGAKQDRDISFVESLITAVRHIASNNPVEFRTLVQSLKASESESIHFVLAYGYLADPSEYAIDIVDYLLEDERRFSIGDQDYESCRLVGACFPHVEQARRVVLEQKILQMYPDWEKHPRSRAWGYTQIRFLRSISRDLLSPQAMRRLQELERKFPDVYPEPRVSKGMIASVSPVSEEKLRRAKDSDILRAMKVYDQSTDWDAPNHHKKGIGIGGIVELSRAISAATKHEPERFYKLAKRFDHEVASEYIGAILNGLAATDSPAEWIFEVASRFADHVAGESRRGFCGALRNCSASTIPEGLLNVLVGWAFTDPDPVQPDPFYETKNIEHANEWLNRGINSVRGVAVQTIMKYLTKPDAIDPLFGFVSEIMKDPSPAVAACVLDSLMPILNIDRQRTLDACELLFETYPELLEDKFSHRFLSFVTFHYFGQFGRFIEPLLQSKNEHNREEGGRLACQAALNNEEALSLRDQALNGDDETKLGAAQCYAMYLAVEDHTVACQESLVVLAHINSEEIQRQVMSCFHHLKPELHFEKLQSFIWNIIQTPAIEIDTHGLLDFVLPLAGYEHALALEVTKRIIEVLKGERARNYFYQDDHLVSLPLAVYNRSVTGEIKEQAMTLFEGLLALNLRSAKTALDNWDEFRKFNLGATS